ncbi:MAG: hypothetical protein DMD40_10830 [Gemmatimonadetes bacterium]|nr:MAG: hypothetical protein DMD40_10830 [Gemmatimonadota bacterium]
MTLGRLVVAWLLIVICFVMTTFASGYLIAKLTQLPPTGPVYTATRLRVLRWRVIEAGLLTLLASLWFDSLGSSEWWLLFLLLGGLASGPRWGQDPVPPRVVIAGTCFDIVRYLVAGSLLAWRLS